MSALLALDPGIHTGVAVRREDGTIVWRTWQLAGAGGVRLNKLADRLVTLHASVGFVAVAYERPFHGPHSNAAAGEPDRITAL
jgi:Bacterial protein of unknown function (DUF905)